MTVPRIRELRVRAVRVPMEQPHQTASGTISESPLVLTDVITEDGTVGHSMIFTYTVSALKPTADLIKNLEPLVKGEGLAPTEIANKLAKRFRLLGMQGLVAMAVASVDMALWDALARSHSTSLVRLLGSTEKPVPAYGAVGYDGETGSARVAEHWAKLGFKGIKAKIHSRLLMSLCTIRPSLSGATHASPCVTEHPHCTPPVAFAAGVYSAIKLFTVTRDLPKRSFAEHSKAGTPAQHDTACLQPGVAVAWSKTK